MFAQPRLLSPQGIILALLVPAPCLAQQEKLTLKGHGGAVQAVAFSPDGKRLATGGDGKTVSVWDVTTGQQLFVARGQSGIQGLAFSPDGRQLACAGADGTVRIFDSPTGKEI